MTRMPQTPAPFWLYYFNVDAIDAAAARVKAKGGRSSTARRSARRPWIVQATDPQGRDVRAWSRPKRC